ncbi:MAG: glycosyltransferase family 4 protein [Candidatus Loosdrechtia sp.]|uniref:glycosyltransferase family 4 protein n=1 Tax=Candidatus Loosdrechtia sp. TaxID=3101272 RepID=UPI003A61664C|nr:MAG: glycosyltransferase [Candidatus Jettenia sp. AMX2]
MNKYVSILHIITGLSVGGAETMLYKLLSRIDRNVFTNQVISLTNKGPLAEKIESQGVPVEALGMCRGMPDPVRVWKLSRSIRNKRPDIIQTWMYHADLIGGLAAKFAGHFPIVWNIRHSNLDAKANKKTTIWTAKACALFSGKIPVRIVSCAESSRDVHVGIGYHSGKMLVIPNGFDLEGFRPDTEAKVSVRRELGLETDALLVGMVGRFDLQKDHQNLVLAAKYLKEQGIDVFFVLCGRGVANNNEMLTGWIREAGLTDRFFLLGFRDDIPRLTAALDIACLSSAFGEGFPNVLGEAMACEIPCVATDVGDSANIIGDTGRVVPPKNPVALGKALKELVCMGYEGRAGLGRSARKRIRERFELSKVVKRYEELYMGLLN